MSPSEIKRYLQARGIAPMSDLVNRFDTDAEALRGVLDFWIRKGRVRRLDGSSECASSCGGCADGVCGTPAASTVYQWLDDTPERRTIPITPAV